MSPIIFGLSDKRKEEQVIEDELKRNGFPEKTIALVNRSMKRRQQTRDGEQAAGSEQDEKTVSIPYIGGVSEAIRRVKAPLGIRTAMRSAEIKWSIMHRIKDKLQSRKIPGVVYTAGFKECKMVYVGETKRTARYLYGTW